MNESKRYQVPRHHERATYDRRKLEEAADRLVELRKADRYEDIAYAVDELPAALHKPVIFALVHRAARGGRDE